MPRISTSVVVVALCTVVLSGSLSAQLRDLDDRGSSLEGGPIVEPSFGGGDVYWLERNAIRRAPLSGLTQQVVYYVNGATPLGIAVDFEAEKVYWSQFVGGQSTSIHRANLDGSGAEQLLGEAAPTLYPALALDTEAGKLYWTFSGFGGTGGIRRADTDGSSPETLIDGVVIGGVALDPRSGRLYFTAGGEIYRGDLDGNNLEPLGGTNAGALALDLERDKLYWISQPPISDPYPPYPQGAFHRSNLDGSGEEFIRDACLPDGLAVDARRGRVYASWGCIPFYFERADVDDLEFETFRIPLRTPHSIVIDERPADADGDGIMDDLDLCPDTIVPESVPTQSLGVNRWALVDDDEIFDTTAPPGGGGGPSFEFTLADTGGCSCEQIIEAMSLGSGHTKFGCSSGAMLQWVGATGGFAGRSAEVEPRPGTPGSLETLMDDPNAPGASTRDASRAPGPWRDRPRRGSDD